MNEFIVWDKKQKKFRCLSSIVFNTNSKWDIDKEDIGIKLVNCWGSPFYDDGECNPDILVKREKGQFSIHPYIGKTDINDKKIYADCSIVKLNYFSSSDWVSDYGYFFFDDENLRYSVHLINEREIVDFENSYFDCMEIIDTIQENKLGLIKG